MARFTSAQMAPKSVGPQQKGAPTAPKPVATTLKVPLGGQLTVRKTSNGFVATTQDKNWNGRTEIVGTDLSKVCLE